MFSMLGALLALSFSVSFAIAQENASLPVNYGMVLFPGFQALDVFGPLDALNILSLDYQINLAVIGPSLDPVTTAHEYSYLSNSNISQRVVPTHSYDNPPQDLDVLIVPGGFGTSNNETFLRVAEFVKTTYPKLDYLISVCAGAPMLAEAGVLDGKKATSNKAGWEQTKSYGNVDWVSHARWVVDGNIWTTSGVSAGLDGIFAFIADKYGEEEAEKVSVILEYTREMNSTNDPFADYYNLP